MHTYKTLIDDLGKTNIDRKGVLMVHSSMKAIGEVEGRGDAVIDSLMTFMKDGLLLMPTHTWHEDNCKDGLYDPEVEPSCVGALTNIFRQRDGVLRSLHPTHSVAAYGRTAKAYIRRDDDVHTPCPKEGCFGSLYEVGAQILFLGATLKTNTFIHSVEEWLNIPDRLMETTKVLRIKQEDGSIKEIDYRGHYNPKGDVSKNYDKLLEPLLELGIACQFKVGDADCILVQVKEMADLVVKFLGKDPDLFVDKRPILEGWYR